MMKRRMVTIDGNQAAAHVAHALNEVIAIYPITPSSPMGEWADEWTTEGKTNIWGTVPHVVEMQSEGGAVAAVHGAAQTGALTTTFTASQGLLLMIPTMFKMAGELTPTVFHVSARTVATHALSIFGDHSDVMACRSTGFGMLASGSIQEIMDLALITTAASLEARIPFLHFFDGFRSSHEVMKIEQLAHDDMRAMIDEELVRAYRARAMTPDRPVLRGSAQNPDVFFQARETVNPFYRDCPDIVQKAMDRFASIAGRQYHLFDYVGAADAERVIVLMGSAGETAHETVDYLTQRGEKIGILKVRLYRPFDTRRFLAALPQSVKSIAVLDRTKEPGAGGEPLYKDVVTALGEAQMDGSLPMPTLPRVIGGRYGLSSKEFTPAMVKAVFDELAKKSQNAKTPKRQDGEKSKSQKVEKSRGVGDRSALSTQHSALSPSACGPKNHFTIGIDEDVTHSSLSYDANFVTESDKVVRALFYGLGSDGTVGANKNSIKIIGEGTDNYSQGYFVYDSKKAGSVTVSHLRFGPDEIKSTYLITAANFIACHAFGFLERYDMLANAACGATFLLNSPHGKEETWDKIPRSVQQQIIDKKMKLFAIDGYGVAKDAGMGRRINTIMQTCFFAISGVLPRDEAITAIKEAIKKTYGIKGEEIVEKNWRAVDQTLANLYEIPVPATATSTYDVPPPVSEEASEFVRNVLGEIIAGRGDAIPTSALPNDGTFPMGTTKWEKRNIALEIPVWDPKVCIQCGKCAFVCPHAAIRLKAYPPDCLAAMPATFQSIQARGKEFDGLVMTIQVAPEDCTGCGICVQVCPAKNKTETRLKAINMAPQPPLRESERECYRFFLALPEIDRRRIKINSVKGSQFLQPLFEYSGACAACGETPYLKLLTQLFGDRLIIANATGCSSIYGGNLPTAPWVENPEGRGPAWCNSLFEDNAEFGFGYRLTLDKHAEYARELLGRLADTVGTDLADALLTADQSDEAGIEEQRQRVETLKEKLAGIDSLEALRLQEHFADCLVKKSVWLVGGDGWAYDIGYGGLDHVLASGRDVNVLVLDTEVYSNTGGQCSKATPRGAVAKFAAGGKAQAQKDLALLAMTYGSIYVATVAMGANDQQTVRAFVEAEAFGGPSIIIAYSHCIAHGINMRKGLETQRQAVLSGHFPLFRYNPDLAAGGKNPLTLDSKRPSISYREYAYEQTRFKMLTKSNPETARRLLALRQQDVAARWKLYEQLASTSPDARQEEEPRTED